MPASMADVAARAGVSTATVSRVLSGALQARPATRERVLEAVRELDYRPSRVARSLRIQKTQTLGLIVSDITNPFYPELVRAAEDAAHERGFAVLLGNASEDAGREADYLDLLAEHRVDGIVVASSGLSERQARWLERASVPVVLVNCEIPGGDLPAILSDNRSGGRQATEHLLFLGHRVIGLIKGPPTSAAADEREDGIRGALADAGLPHDALRTAVGDGHVASAARALAELLAADASITAIVCHNDMTATGALGEARARGLRVPEDLSLVGFDGIELGRHLDPPLTTIRQDVGTMGHWAVEWLAARLGSGGAALRTGSVVRLPVTLLVRGSTGPAPRRP